MTVRATSKAAFAVAKPKLPTIKQRVYELMKQFTHSGGLTADECASLLDLREFSVRPSVTILGNEAKLVDSGARRPTISGRDAIVWVCA